jgi:bifunctional UDP-N-acetylglucosamine pyrophosphorylase/glucosamine-1-phosphate N-acetyltransferase
VTIGAGATVGANALVSKNHDVAEGQTVVGVPARPLKPRSR